MNIDKDWEEIEDIFDCCVSSSKHAAIATVDVDGNPHITPIGFVFLTGRKKAIYFEQYSKTLPTNYKVNSNVCLLLVNSSTFFWAKSLFKGRFSAYPGIRLYGEADELRSASEVEMKLLEARIGGAKLLKGSKLIWSGLKSVREINLTSVRPIEYPKMMEHLIGDNVISAKGQQL